MTQGNPTAIDDDAMSPERPLAGIRVVELTDELGEYCGLLLAGLGAEVVKVEPPEGSSTREIGPFYRDRPGPERSLFFWQYNRGKSSVVLDLADDEGRAAFGALLEESDILLHSPGSRDSIRFAASDGDLTSGRLQHLIVGRLSAFGWEGPWAHYRGSDLIHLALGGVMMNCGYDPDPRAGTYDTPPIAPAMWHSYHIAGEQLLMGILAALLRRNRSGRGQVVDCAVHEAVSKCTEIDLMSWIMRRAPVHRQTCRHAQEDVDALPSIGNTKDGRWVICQRPIRAERWENLPRLLEWSGLQAPEDSKAPPVENSVGRAIPGTRPGPSSTDDWSVRSTELMHRVVKKHRFRSVPWLKAQEYGFLWAPLRKPHENVADPHWEKRGTFAGVEHEDIGETFQYASSKWLASGSPWRPLSRAPKLGEHQGVLAGATGATERRGHVQPRRIVRADPDPLGGQSEGFPLQGVRVLDFTWFLASGGATRFLAALGAEVIKVEWEGNPDTRLGAMAPVGGRDARDAATEVLPPVMDRDMGGQFNNKHPGKYGISLNVKSPRGLELARQLVEKCDIVAEGFAPGVMDRWGLGFDELRQLNPEIIYCQQSGMGAAGEYQHLRTVGPIAQAFSGISEMSGLPEPAMPAGWGYSYLDWMGAYSFAQAMLAGLYFRDITGKGQHVDASQCEIGLYLSGTAIVDWSANGREWARLGNASPYKKAAPHGAYPCAGEDRWIAIACFEETEWRELVEVLGCPELREDSRFSTLPNRLGAAEELDAELQRYTSTFEPYSLMHSLQARGIAAGVCQTAEDRVDKDPQLGQLQWLTELEGTKIGRWPIPNVPFRMSDAVTHIGGPTGRAAPCYGEDNYRIYGSLLGLSSEEIGEMESAGVI